MTALWFWEQQPTKLPRFHIRAWGSRRHPDLDYYADSAPLDLLWRYPFVDTALTVPIPLEALRARL